MHRPVAFGEAARTAAGVPELDNTPYERKRTDGSVRIIYVDAVRFVPGSTAATVVRLYAIPRSAPLELRKVSS
jgi:hypothetical protein